MEDRLGIDPSEEDFYKIVEDNLQEFDEMKNHTEERKYRHDMRFNEMKSILDSSSDEEYENSKIDSNSDTDSDSDDNSFLKKKIPSSNLEPTEPSSNTGLKNMAFTKSRIRNKLVKKPSAISNRSKNKTNFSK